MKRNLLLFIVFTLLCFNHQWLLAQRSVVNIDEAWKFGDSSSADVASENFDDSGWENINLPHTWNGIDGQDGGNNLYRGAKWYRKSLLAETAWQGKKVFIRFGAANMKTDVYINGQAIGSHTGGYAAFIFDITDYLNWGVSNTVAVKVDNSYTIDAAPLSGDFSFFGGISRSVELIVTEPVFISPLDYASPGIYITPDNITNTNADVNIKVLVGNHSAEAKDIEVMASIKDADGIEKATVSTTISVDANATVTASLDTKVANPVLWNAKINPYLYKVDITLKTDGTVADVLDQPLGFRTYAVNDDTGFSLNGEAYSLHGVCHHEDRPDIGRAISDAQRKEDLDMLTEDLGCTYLRLVHYQHAEYTYDYCDKNGIVLSTEIPLVNKISSSTAFSDNAKSQLKELIKQNYNHPSILFWGMFNEVNFHEGPDPATLVGELHQLSKELDAHRLTTGAAQNDEADTHWLLDVCGWNKYMGWYDGSFQDFATWADWLRDGHPDTKIALSEYGAGASVKHHQEYSVRPNPAGMFHPEEYQADYHEAYYQAMLQRPYIWSTAVWVAFDFASDYRAEGDALGINDKGLVTRDRQVKKDAYYYYKAHWNDEPFAYITSRRFVERSNQITKVKVYSNCNSVELMVNGQTIGTLESTNHIFTWEDITLAEGENTIQVKGHIGEQTYLDECVWNYTKSPNDALLPGDIQINFQTTNSVTPEGYLADDGSTFADRGNGYSYGWTPENKINTRERNYTADQVFNTFNHIIKDGVNYTWEMAVENGVYKVSVGCGDPDYTDSYHKIMVEGELVLEGFNTSTSMKVATDTVTVLDGRLTVTAASGASNAKLNLVHLTKLEEVALSGLEMINGSFELPAGDIKYRADGAGGASPFNGNVPGWWAESGTTDCGRQNSGKPAYEGKYCAYAFNNDGGSIWALAGIVEEEKRNLSLSYYAWESYPKGQVGVSVVAKFAVYEGDDPSNYTEIETLKQSFDPAQVDANGWEHFIFEYMLPENTIGKKLLIGFDVVTEDAADSWYCFDDFTLNIAASDASSVVEGVSATNHINVYPNPAHDSFTISTQSGNENGTYALYNISGKLLLAGSFSAQNSTVDVSSFHKGVYILKVSDSSGASIKKIVIE